MPVALIPIVWAWCSSAVPKLISFLFSPAGAILCIALAFGGGDLWGRHKSSIICNNRVAAMQAAARRQDAEAQEQASTAHAGDLASEKARETAAEERITSYEQHLAQKGGDGSCELDNDDLRILAPGGVR